MIRCLCFFLGSSSVFSFTIFFFQIFFLCVCVRRKNRKKCFSFSLLERYFYNLVCVYMRVCLCRVCLLSNSSCIRYSRLPYRWGYSGCYSIPCPVERSPLAAGSRAHWAGAKPGGSQHCSGCHHRYSGRVHHHLRPRRDHRDQPCLLEMVPPRFLL